MSKTTEAKGSYHCVRYGSVYIIRLQVMPDANVLLPTQDKGTASGTDNEAESLQVNRLIGLVVKASASRAEDPGFESRLSPDFFGVESYQ